MFFTCLQTVNINRNDFSRKCVLIYPLKRTKLTSPWFSRHFSQVFSQSNFFSQDKFQFFTRVKKNIFIRKIIKSNKLSIAWVIAWRKWNSTSPEILWLQLLKIENCFEKKNHFTVMYNLKSNWCMMKERKVFGCKKSGWSVSWS